MTLTIGGNLELTNTEELMLYFNAISYSAKQFGFSPETSGMVWFQTVCKSNQQTILTGQELIQSKMIWVMKENHRKMTIGDFAIFSL